MHTQDNPLKIIFLFGAGASKPAGILTIGEMTEGFSKDPTQAKTGSLIEDLVFKMLNTSIQKIVESLSKITNEHFGRTDLELMMSVLLHLEDKTYRELFEQKYPLLEDLFSYEYKKDDKKLPMSVLKHIIQNYIRKTCENTHSVDYLWPIRGLVGNKPLNIFTLNYDGTIESFCEKNNIPYTDGFDPYWNTANFEKNYDINLFKLHGSLYWLRSESGKVIKVPIQGLAVPNLKYLTGEKVSEMMIYPALQKNKEPAVYSWLAQKFKEEINSSEICVVIGYSFRDNDLRESITESLRGNDKLWLLIVNPDASKHKEQFFSNNDDIASRIVIMNMGIEESLTDRILHSHLNILTAAMTNEKFVWDLQARNRNRLDSKWSSIIQHYLDIEHDDRVKWIIEKLSKQRFTSPDGMLSNYLEVVLGVLTFRYMFEYHHNKNKEKMEIWSKIFLDVCIINEFMYFANSGLGNNPINENEVPSGIRYHGYTTDRFRDELEQEIENIKSKVIDNRLQGSLDKLTKTLNFMKNEINELRPKMNGNQIYQIYQNNSLGLKKNVMELVGILDEKL